MEEMMLFVSEGHWFAAHVRWTEDMLLVLFPDARTGMISTEVRSFFQAFQKALGKTYLELNHTNLVQRKDSICGALAIVHITWLLGIIVDADHETTQACGKLKSLVIQSFPVVTVEVTMQVLGVYELKL